MLQSNQMLTQPMSTLVKSADMIIKEVCPSGQAFFGLTTEYINSVYEQMFVMTMRTNFSFSELYSFTVVLRSWIFDQTIKYFKKENEK